MYYTENEPLLRVEHLSKSYGTKLVLKDINLEIKNIVVDGSKQGQIVAVLGRSGRGKSTFLRILSGLELQSSGTIKIPDFSKSKDNNGEYLMKDVLEGDVGFVDQKYTLFRHKTIKEALYFAMRKTDFNATKKDEIVNKYIKEWGLEGCKNQYPNELSGGQRQRTAIIEQILNSSNFLVLDEPFSGLDVGNINNVKNAFKLIDSSSDLNTIIFSTHDINLAVCMADKIYVLGYQGDEVSVLLRTYDLKATGLAWKNEMTSKHYELVGEITELLLKS